MKQAAAGFMLICRWVAVLETICEHSPNFSNQQHLQLQNVKCCSCTWVVPINMPWEVSDRHVYGATPTF